MNTLLVVTLFSFAAITSAVPSGILGGALVAGPAGVVTNAGAIAAVNGLGLGGAVLAAPAASAIISPAAAAIATRGVIAAPALGLAGLGAITNGGGAIGVSGAGATVAGPRTAPVVVAGPSGKIAADGLWGPTANIGLGALGKVW